MLVSSLPLKLNSPKGFVVIEGVNGSGKSTLIRSIASYAESQGRDLLTTFEPGGTPLGAKLRQILLGSENSSSLAELFLFNADRAEHVSKVIRPALDKGTLVVSDRYFYSTIAFQGYGRGLDLDLINSLCDLAIQELTPDLVILLDMDPAKGLSRNITDNSKRGVDAFESEALAFHTRIRNGFLEIAKTSPTPFHIISAEAPAAEVFSEALTVLKKLGLL